MPWLRVLETATSMMLQSEVHLILGILARRVRKERGVFGERRERKVMNRCSLTVRLLTEGIPRSNWPEEADSRPTRQQWSADVKLNIHRRDAATRSALGPIRADAFGNGRTDLTQRQGHSR